MAKKISGNHTESRDYAGNRPSGNLDTDNLPAAGKRRKNWGWKRASDRSGGKAQAIALGFTMNGQDYFSPFFKVVGGWRDRGGRIVPAALAAKHLDS